MHVEILSIGAELLEGLAVNTNAVFLSQQLKDAGYIVTRHTVLPDQPDQLEKGIKEALARTPIVIATGGLGPTLDDCTKEVACRIFRTSLQFDSDVYEEFCQRFEPSEFLESQAMLPPDGVILPNLLGTAPGLVFFSSEGSLIALPGVCQEMQKMFLESVLPVLKTYFPLSSQVGQSLSLSFCLLKEEQIDPLLREIQEEHPDVKIGIYPTYGTVRIHLQVWERFSRLQQWKEMLSERFSAYLFPGQSIQEAVHCELIEKKRRLALVESCTGGSLSAAFVKYPGASSYLLGSLVLYSNAWKEKWLELSQIIEESGAVSEDAVSHMVHQVLEKGNGDLAIAISGVTGPTEVEGKPVGTIYLALGDLSICFIKKIQAPPSRQAAIEMAVEMAFVGLWRYLSGQAQENPFEL